MTLPYSKYLDELRFRDERLKEMHLEMDRIVIERDEIKRLALLLLHLLGDSIVVNQDEHGDFIEKILKDEVDLRVLQMHTFNLLKIYIKDKEENNAD